jgi:uncharacterized membrane protein YgdD (TMEM256/DUF423 family)
MKKFLLAGSLGCALSVTAGAFGAHSLKQVLDGTLMETYKTATFYMFLHSLGLLIIPLLQKQISSISTISPSLILAGIVFFSGSLYIYIFFHIKFMVYITPLGGISFIAGWLLLFLNIIKWEKD